MTPLQVLSQSPSKLVVHSPASVFSWEILIGLVLGYGICTLAYTGMPRRATRFQRNIPVYVALFLTLLFAFTTIWSHTITLSRQSGTAVLVDRLAGIPYSTQQIPLASMERATLESARPGTRIAIVLRGGQVVWPFGKAYNSPPNQYAIIDEINEFLENDAQKMLDEN